MESKNMTYEIEKRLSETVKRLNDILVDLQLAEYEQEQEVNVLYWLNKISEALREGQMDFNVFQDNSKSDAKGE